MVCLLVAASVRAATKTLVLVDTLATRETHSIFLKDLTGELESFVVNFHTVYIFLRLNEFFSCFFGMCFFSV